MKKVLFFVLCLLTLKTLAQPASNKIELTKVTFGAVFASSGSIQLKGEVKPFTLGYNLSPNVCFVTNKSYHNFLYGFGNNAGKIVTGYLVKKDLGAYAITQKSFASRNGYFALGMEKFVKAGDMNFFLFVEVGRNTYPATTTLTLGVHANIQTPLWKKR